MLDGWTNVSKGDASRVGPTQAYGGAEQQYPLDSVDLEDVRARDKIANCRLLTSIFICDVMPAAT
jgi:hypothetical protein